MAKAAKMADIWDALQCAWGGQTERSARPGMVRHRLKGLDRYTAMLFGEGRPRPIGVRLST